MYGNAYAVAATKQSAANAKKYEYNGIPRGAVVGPGVDGKFRRHLGNNQWQEVTRGAFGKGWIAVPKQPPPQQAAQQPVQPQPQQYAPPAPQPAQPQAPAPQQAAAQQGAAAPVPASTYAGGKPTAAQTPTSYVGGAVAGQYTAPRGRGRSRRFY